MRTIEKIANYIRYTYYSPNAATTFRNNMFSIILKIKLFPRIGKEINNNSNRVLIYKKYLIFYKIQEKEKIIKIQRIINGRINK